MAWKECLTKYIPNFDDVNPNLSAAEPFRLAMKYYSSTSTCSSTCVRGYSTVKVKPDASSGYSVIFYDNSGTMISGSTTSLTSTNWTEIQIPDGAYIMKAKYSGTSSSSTVRNIYFALFV